MAAIYEAFLRLRRAGTIEVKRQQSLDFLRSLPIEQGENVGAIIVVLNSINRGFNDVNFSLVGQLVLAHGQIEGPRREVDFLIVNDAKAKTPLRERAINYLNGELNRQFSSGGRNLLRPVYLSPWAYRVIELCYGSCPTRFYITGKNWDDSHVLKAAADTRNDGYFLLNPQP